MLTWPLTFPGAISGIRAGAEDGPCAQQQANAYQQVELVEVAVLQASSKLHHHADAFTETAMRCTQLPGP